MESKKGVFVHVLIHFLVTALVLLPFLLSGYLWLLFVIFALSFVHFWIDQAKISYDLHHDYKVLPFIVDQILHLLTILVIYFFVYDLNLALPDTAFNAVYSDLRIFFFLSFIIFGSKVIEVYRFQKQREKNKKATFRPNADKMMTRILVLTALFSLFMLLSFYARGNQFL